MGTEHDIEMLINGKWEFRFMKPDQFYAETNAQILAQSRKAETRVVLNKEVIAQYDEQGNKISVIKSADMGINYA